MDVAGKELMSLMHESHSASSSFASMASFMSSLIQDSVAHLSHSDYEKFTIDIVDDNAKLDLEHHNGIRHTQSLVVMRRNRSMNKQISRWENKYAPARMSDLNLSSGHHVENPSLPFSTGSSRNNNMSRFQKSTSESLLLKLPTRKESPRLTSRTKAPTYQKGGKKPSTNAIWTAADVAPTSHSNIFDLTVSLSPQPSDVVVEAPSAKSMNDAAILVPRRRISKDPDDFFESGPSLPRRKTSLDETNDSEITPVALDNETALKLKEGPGADRHSSATKMHGGKTSPSGHRSVSPKRRPRDLANQPLLSSSRPLQRSSSLDRMPRRSMARGPFPLPSNRRRGKKESILNDPTFLGLNVKIDGK